MSEDEIKKYLVLLKSWKFEDKLKAAEQIGNSKDPRAVEPLIEEWLPEKIVSGEEGKLQKVIIDALAKIGDEKALEILVNMACNIKSYRSDDAITALVKVGPPAVEPIIEKLKEYKDMPEKVRKDLNLRWFDYDMKMKSGILANVLSKIGTPAVGPLIKALGEQYDEVRACAADALGRIGDKRAFEHLRQCVNDKAPNVRWHSCHACYLISKDINFLIQTLKDENKFVRFAAVTEIEGTRRLWTGGNEIELKKDKRTLDPLIFLLNDDWDKIRILAATSLGNLKDKRAVEPLIQLLKDKDKRVAIYACIALGNIGDESAIDPLIIAAKNFDWFQNKAYIRALCLLGNQVIEPFIQACKSEYDKHLVRSVLLGEIFLDNEEAEGVRKSFLIRLGVRKSLLKRQIRQIRQIRKLRQTGEKSSEGCFIATAVFEDSNHPTIIPLRNFRDNILKSNPIGKIVIQIYYKVSPHFANYIIKIKLLKRLLKFILKGISKFLESWLT